jgi:hypothetical protein
MTIQQIKHRTDLHDPAAKIHGTRPRGTSHTVRALATCGRAERGALRGHGSGPAPLQSPRLATRARTVPSDERSPELIDDVVLKPAAVCRWIFTLLGAAPGDTLDDLFPARVRWAGRGPGWRRTCGCWTGKLARL